MAAGSTYTPIATTTLGSAASTVDFNSISGSYTDLVLICNTGTTSGLNYALSLQINGNTSSVYSGTRLIGNGSSATSSRYTGSNTIYGFTQSGSIISNVIFHFMNYSNTTTYKTVLQRFNRADAGTVALVALYPSTSAITSLSLSAELGGTTFLAGSTFTLYGITAA